jgi:hypothetical protein
MTYLIFMLSVLLVCEQTACKESSTSGKTATDLLVGGLCHRHERRIEKPDVERTSSFFFVSSFSYQCSFFSGPELEELLDWYWSTICKVLFSSYIATQPSKTNFAIADRIDLAAAVAAGRSKVVVAYSLQRSCDPDRSNVPKGQE